MSRDTFYYQAVKSTYREESIIELHEAFVTEGRVILGSPVMLLGTDKKDLEEKLLKMYIDVKKYGVLDENVYNNSIETEEYLEDVPDVLDMFND